MNGSRNITDEVDKAVMEAVRILPLCQISQRSGDLKALIQSCVDGASEEEVGMAFRSFQKRISGLVMIAPFLKENTPERYHYLFG
jgi:hypothetical protein